MNSQTELNEARDLPIVERLMTDERLVPLQSNVRTFYLTIVVLDLTIRHPGLGKAMKALLTEIADQIRGHLADRWPEVMRLSSDLSEAETDAIMGDTHELIVALSIKDLWLMIAAFTLAMRHEGLDALMLSLIMDLAHQLQAYIVEFHPDANRLIEAGYDPANDR